MSPLFDGLALGLAFVAPIGALNIYLVESALSQGAAAGFRAAFAVSAFDVLLGLACFFGIGAVFTYFPVLKPVLLAGGTVFLSWMGWRLMTAKAIAVSGVGEEKKTARCIWRSALVLTWCNPHALLDGTLLLGGVRASMPAASHLPFVLGASLALPIWYFSLVGIVQLLRTRFSPTVFQYVQRFCGLVLWAFAVKFGLALFA